MTKVGWKAFPYPEAVYDFAGVALRHHWPRLHRGDCEPFPDEIYWGALVREHRELEPPMPLNKAVSHLRDAWRAYHRGDFGLAREQGLALGRLGYNVANKASNIYATYLAPNQDEAQHLYQESMRRAEELQACARTLPNAWYLHGQALGRYSQSISIAAALTQGLAGKVKASLDRALALEPHHADAHIALGAYHAEIIGKMGALLGSLTYGVSKDAAIGHFETSLKLNPDSAIARIEYASALTLMFGRSRASEVRRLHEAAAACQPSDAMEHLDMALAKSRMRG